MGCHRCIGLWVGPGTVLQSNSGLHRETQASFSDPCMPLQNRHVSKVGKINSEKGVRKKKMCAHVTTKEAVTTFLEMSMKQAQMAAGRS